MRKTEYDFQGNIQYTFTRMGLDDCIHCGKSEEAHAGTTCLFEATTFEIHPLKAFLKDLLFRGGEFKITTPNYVLTQKMMGRAQDCMPKHVVADIRVLGPAKLEERSAKKRT